MPKCMHLVPGMTSLNTKKRKIKITKTRMLKLKEDYRLHTKAWKHKKVPLMLMSFEDYIKYRHGTLKFKKRKSENYISHTSSITRTKSKPKSRKMDIPKNACARKEPMVYDGERKLIGIGMLHKSNLIPIFDREHAKDIAKMRR